MQETIFIDKWLNLPDHVRALPSDRYFQESLDLLEKWMYKEMQKHPGYTVKHNNMVFEPLDERFPLRMKQRLGFQACLVKTEGVGIEPTLGA